MGFNRSAFKNYLLSRKALLKNKLTTYCTVLFYSIHKDVLQCNNPNIQMKVNISLCLASLMKD